MIPGLKTRVFSLHDVLMYLALARKHLRLMLLLLTFSLMCGLTFYIFARPVYHAQALIHVEYFPRDGDTEMLYRDSTMQGLPYKLTAPHILARTAKTLGVDASNRDLEQKYMTRIRANYNSQSNLVVDVWVALPQLAERWTETMVDEFLAYRTEKRRADREAANEILANEIEDLSKRLGIQLNQRLSLEDASGLTQIQIELQSLGDVPGRLGRIQSQIDEMGKARIQLQDPSYDVVAKLALISKIESQTPPLEIGSSIATPGKKEDDKIIVVVPAIANVHQEHPWDELVREREKLNAEIVELGKIHLPGSFKMAGPMKKLADIDGKLEVSYQTSQRRFDLSFQQLLNEKQTLEGKLPAYKAANGRQQKIFMDLGIQQGSAPPFQNYLQAAMKRMEMIDYGNEKERINLDYAGLIDSQDRPVSPNRLKLIALSFIIGLALALAVPFAIEYLDHTLRTLDQVENAFHMRALGIVPQIESSAGTAALISRANNHKDSLIENFRVIRTNVLSMGNLTKQPHVIMVTSAMPKEGKTVVSSNLAVSFAHTGARTLLMDTDLRRGRLHRLFGYRKDPGLSNVLLGEVALEEACRPTGQENLSILSAGRHLDSGTELIGSARFRDIMEMLRERYDRIVVDTPPVLGLSETSIMQSLVDGVLFVIWTGNTPARSARTAVDTLTANGANFYGFVLNRLDLSATANYYQYYYYSHDYYYQRPLENA
ncbi:MAG: polysaccharide biosynthesis tyrosine autokinase [Chthoniobacter sp.]|nr:polysaccharide biosynthesis tyrosine autokinase [Chthoniobacter sp.]